MLYANAPSAVYNRLDLGKRPKISLPLALLAATCGCAPGAAGLGIGTEQGAITDGEPEAGHAEVGLFIQGALVCTATLVGRRTALTAAHCLDGSGKASLRLDGQAYPVAEGLQHPGWDRGSLANDLALIRLATEPAAAAVAVNHLAPAKGDPLVLVGYGATAETATDALVKRSAENQVAELKGTRFTVAGTGGEKGNICHGDSGGAALGVRAGTQVLVGVASAGLPPCGTLGYFTRVDAYGEWLAQASAGDLQRPPAPDPAASASEAPDPAAQLLAADGKGCGVAGSPPVLWLGIAAPLLLSRLWRRATCRGGRSRHV